MFNQDAFYYCGDTPQQVYLTISQLTKHLMDKFNIKSRELQMAEFLYPDKPLFNYEAITAWVFDVLSEQHDLN